MTLQPFEKPLLRGTLERRYKRFLADITLETGEVVVAHCPNTGSMLGLADPGNPAYVTFNDDPARKLKYTLEMVDVGTSLVGVNTARPNMLVYNAVAGGEIAPLTGYTSLKREQKYGVNSRIDLLLEKPGEQCFVEVKNTTLRAGDEAVFPDAVTTRGAKHLDELMAMVAQGHRAVMFYLVQRMDCQAFNVAAGIDPVYAEKLHEATRKGVEVLAWQCELSPRGIGLSRRLPLAL